MGYELGLMVAALIVVVGIITTAMALVRRHHNGRQPEGAQTSASLDVNPGPGSRATVVGGLLLVTIGVCLAWAMVVWHMDFMLAVALPVGLLVIPFLIVLTSRWVRSAVTSRDS